MATVSSQTISTPKKAFAAFVVTFLIFIIARGDLPKWKQIFTTKMGAASSSTASSSTATSGNTTSSVPTSNPLATGASVLQTSLSSPTTNTTTDSFDSGVSSSGVYDNLVSF